MAEPGSPCSPDGDIGYTQAGEVLFCRDGRWEFVGEPPPVSEGGPGRLWLWHVIMRIRDWIGRDDA